MKKTTLALISILSFSAALYSCSGNASNNEGDNGATAVENDTTVQTILDSVPAQTVQQEPTTTAPEAKAQEETAPQPTGIAFSFAELITRISSTNDVFRFTPNNGTSVMANLGFAPVGKSKGSVYDEMDGSYITATMMVYKQGENTVEMYYNPYNSDKGLLQVVINFGDKAEADKFYKSSQKSILNGIAYWNMTKSGKKITIVITESMG